MKQATKVLFILALLAAVLVLSGCNLSASRAPEKEPTATSEAEFITELPSGESVLGEFGTQTAQAAGPAVATETPVPDAAPAEEQQQPEATSAPAQEQQQQEQPQQQQQQQAAVSIPTLTRPETYILQKGEFPFCIARRFDVNVGDLLALNGLSTNSVVGAGTTLKIPSSGNYSGDRKLRDHKDYTVQSGDTLHSIACYFGDVSPEAILAVNGLGGAGDVKAGMTLKIP